MLDLYAEKLHYQLLFEEHYLHVGATPEPNKGTQVLQQPHPSKLPVYFLSLCLVDHEAAPWLLMVHAVVTNADILEHLKALILTLNLLNPHNDHIKHLV